METAVRRNRFFGRDFIFGKIAFPQAISSSSANGF
jgi:hypothetical protein